MILSTKIPSLLGMLQAWVEQDNLQVHCECYRQVWMPELRGRRPPLICVVNVSFCWLQATRREELPDPSSEEKRWSGIKRMELETWQGRGKSGLRVDGQRRLPGEMMESQIWRQGLARQRG